MDENFLNLLNDNSIEELVINYTFFNIGDDSYYIHRLPNSLNKIYYILNDYGYKLEFNKFDIKQCKLNMEKLKLDGHSGIKFDIITNIINKMIES